MKFSLKLLEDDASITRLVLENLQDQLQNKIFKALPSISSDIKMLVKNALINEPEYSSLKAGTLKAEFGISNSSAIDSVIDALVNTLEVQSNPVKLTKNSLSGGFVLKMIKSDNISGIIYTDIASVIDDVNGYVLPWLEWLLLRGNEIIVRKYSVNYVNSPRSRSGMALMVQSNKSWRVPPNFSGTENNNWITRAISKIDKEIVRIIQSSLED